ncbi:MAG: carboxypeptidase-like regulatory domain-containing protein [Candidatus Paceibacterota bacterium]|jgi:hypothetical protein
MIKITKQILLLIIVILIIIGFYFGYNYFIDSKLRSDAKRLSERELYINTKFGGLVDKTKMTEGFWYTVKDQYGNESIAFFDPSALAGSDLTQEEIDMIYGQVKSSEISDKNRYEVVPEEKLSENMQFYNSVLSSPVSQNENQYVDIKKNLISLFKNGNATKDDLIQLAYIYELEGKYSDKDLINKKICASFKIRCTQDLQIEIRGYVKDSRGWLVQNAKVDVLSDDNASSVLTNENGAYLIKMKANELQKIRLKVTKKGYSDGIVSLQVLYKEQKKYQAEDAVIKNANYQFTLDTKKRTITGDDNKIEGDTAIVKTSQSTYSIPLNVFFDKNGNYFSGQVEIVAYEFTRETVPVSIMAVDTFDTVRGYAGNLMQTFGMPYIQFYDKDGGDLFVRKSSPIKLIYKMYHMEDLYSGDTNIYEPVTEKDVSEMITYCKNSKEEYPITREFLIENRLLKFPAWWIFDQSKGVWDNIGYKLLDSSGTIETIFYTIKDVV